MLSLARTTGTIFDDLFSFSSSENTEQMKCIVYETADAYTFDFDVPGIKRDDIEVSLENFDLTVTAKRSTTKPEGASLLRSEKVLGFHKRVFRLDQRFVETEKVEAKLEDGVLNVRVPKSTVVKPTKISIM